jgi:DNA helicase II / ATP-dependent DNA helicase PcrA
MKIAKDFYKHVPIEKRKIVKNKLNQFAEAIIKSKVFSDVQKGFWIRRIIGTDIYKFRVNSGDRILFRFDKSDGTINFLSYETHDDQVRSARSFQDVDLEAYEINMAEYADEDNDIKIDQYAKQELLSKFYVIEQQDVLDEEYISLLIENPLLHTSNVLTREQFECLTFFDKVVVIHGCAGSGKTSIGIRKLLLNEELAIPTIYVSHSSYLMNTVKETFFSYKRETEYISFCSLQQLYERVLQKKFIVVSLQDFLKWYEQNRLQNEQITLTPQAVFLEINTVIKGEAKDKALLGLDEYLVSSSFLSITEKKYVYFIASLYQQWLQTNKYVDLNDLATMVLKEKGQYISLIVDEMQELTQKQLDSIIHLAIGPNQLMVFGDYFQVLQNYKFSIEQMKQHLAEKALPYEIISISKNFRSGSNTVKLLNEIKHLKQSYYPSMIPEKEEAVRESTIPKVIVNPIKLQRLATHINQNANAIVIVANANEKQKIKQYGFDRVFLIDEVQGLQYKDIFCINLMKINDTQLKLKEIPRKHAQLNSVYLNQLYLAASRSIEQLCFIEEETTTLLNAYMSYLEETNLDSLLCEPVTETSREEWFYEGQQLKLLGKYEQAIDAFTKAGSNEEISQCKNLLARTKNYDHLKEYEAILKFDWHIQDANQLVKCLTVLEEQYGVRMIGNISYFVTKIDGQILHRQHYLSPSSSVKEQGNEIYSLIDYDYALKQTLFISGSFYRGNEPIHIYELFAVDDIHSRDLLILFNNNKVTVKATRLFEQHSIKERYHSFDKNRYEWQGLLDTFNVDIHREKAHHKKSAKDFLDDIFS